MIVRAASPGSLSVLARATGLAVTGDFKGIEAVDASGVVHAVVGYDKWTLNSVRVHALFGHYVSRLLFYSIFHYPFVQAAKGVLVAEIAETNQRSRRLTEKLGFKELARILDGWDKGVSTIIYTMRREDCRWIQKEAGHELRGEQRA